MSENSAMQKEQLGRVLKQRREEMQISQKELAEKTGYSERQIQNAEAGIRTSDDAYQIIAQALRYRLLKDYHLIDLEDHEK